MTKKTPVKAAPAKKSAAKKTPAKATAVTKTAATKTAAKAGATKAATTKAGAAKTAATKSAVKTAATKSAVKTAPAKAAPATKTVAKKASAKAAPATKTPATKTAAPKTPAKAAPATKAAPVKKAAAKAPAAKAAPVKTSAVKKPAAKTAPAAKSSEKPVSKAVPAENPLAPPVPEKAPIAPLEPANVPVAKIERDAHIVEKRADATVLRAQPASAPPAPRTRTIVAPASSAATASSLPSPLKRARPVHRPDPQGADALFLAHAAAAGLEGASVETAWARMPLFAPLLALALVRQGADAVVHATIRAAASEVPDADVVDALAALSAPSRRAVQTLAEARDEATLARKPARASLLDAIQHALEGALAREEGDAATAYERGIEVGRALTAAVALGRRLDASEPEQRAEVVRLLQERLLALSPALPTIG